MDINIILGVLLVIFIVSVGASLLSIIFDKYRIGNISMTVMVISAVGVVIVIVASKLFLNIEI